VAGGMGAIALAHRAVLRPGDHLLSSEWICGGVHRLFAQEFGPFGIDVSFLSPLESRTWKRALKNYTRVIRAERPALDRERMLVSGPLSVVCKPEGLVRLEDAKFATAISCRR